MDESDRLLMEALPSPSFFLFLRQWRPVMVLMNLARRSLGLSSRCCMSTAIIITVIMMIATFSHVTTTFDDSSPCSSRCRSYTITSLHVGRPTSIPSSDSTQVPSTRT